MGKEEGAPETLHQKAEPPGHLQMVVPTGAPIHLLPHSYGGAMARQGQKKIRVSLCRERAWPCRAYLALVLIPPSPRFHRQSWSELTCGSQGFTSYDTLLPWHWYPCFPMTPLKRRKQLFKKMNSSRSKATESYPILANAHKYWVESTQQRGSISLPLEGCLKMTPSDGHQGQPQGLEWVQGLVSVRARSPIQTATPGAWLCSGKPQRLCLLSMGLKSLSMPFFADSCGEGFSLASIFPEHSRSSQGLWGRVWPGLGGKSTIWVKANITDSFHGQHRVP